MIRQDEASGVVLAVCSEDVVRAELTIVAQQGAGVEAGGHRDLGVVELPLIGHLVAAVSPLRD